MLREFRDFLMRGNLVEIAVGLILALAFSQVVAAFVSGILTPLIAAIFGQPNFASITFSIGDGIVRIGAFLDAVISFVITGWALFLVVKVYNRLRKPAEEEAAGPTEQELLVEIRDELRARRTSG
jgi:large conductance mechanosensitive channel